MCVCVCVCVCGGSMCVRVCGIYECVGHIAKVPTFSKFLKDIYKVEFRPTLRD